VFLRLIPLFSARDSHLPILRTAGQGLVLWLFSSFRTSKRTGCIAFLDRRFWSRHVCFCAHTDHPRVPIPTMSLVVLFLVAIFQTNVASHSRFSGPYLSPAPHYTFLRRRSGITGSRCWLSSPTRPLSSLFVLLDGNEGAFFPRGPCFPPSTAVQATSYRPW